MAAEGRRSRLRRLGAGVRFRTTVVALGVIAVVLTVAAVVLATQTRARIESSLTSSADARAEALAVLLDGAAIPDPLPGRASELFAQVIMDGEVRAADPGLSIVAPFTTVAPPAGVTERLDVESIFEEVEDRLGLEDEGPYRVIARGAATAEGPATIVVAVSLEDAGDAVQALVPILWGGLPLLLAAVGALVWRLTGRALRPVDDMRREAAAISARELDRRLPLPGSEDELHRLAETLNDMLERLEASSARQRRFVADASHELKSPIASMRAMIEVASDDPDFAEWRRLLADLLREDRRLELLVGDLLALARADEGAAPNRIELDLDQIIGREARLAATTYARQIDTSRVEALRMWGDPDGLTRLFRNLLDNAARHAAARVSVRAGSGNGEVIVAVSDDGPGIPPAAEERIFERFVRLDEGRGRDEGGTGLGLAVARAVARSHGGDVAVVAPQDGGATFEVRLPRGGPS